MTIPVKKVQGELDYLAGMAIGPFVFSLDHSRLLDLSDWTKVIWQKTSELTFGWQNRLA